ncbi:hypothetical protein J2851_004055 [Azospirillum rugosum]|uniref:Uncharacterized protein n=1 Tax=Azospirillum rugosum TaxID=416170 RepID=A0ABS4SNX9_9PROT|nr:hypothetical protein [Azospirillum rugosum]MDQ0527601.1 hypothetical protein [Azospirillum rugosum]
MSPTFEGLYSRIGRPLIPLEKQLWTLPLQAYSLRLERQSIKKDTGLFASCAMRPLRPLGYGPHTEFLTTPTATAYPGNPA